MDERRATTVFEAGDYLRGKREAILPWCLVSHTARKGFNDRRRISGGGTAYSFQQFAGRACWRWSTCTATQNQDRVEKCFRCIQKRGNHFSTKFGKEAAQRKRGVRNRIGSSSRHTKWLEDSGYG